MLAPYQRQVRWEGGTSQVNSKFCETIVFSVEIGQLKRPFKDFIGNNLVKLLLGKQYIAYFIRRKIILKSC